MPDFNELTLMFLTLILQNLNKLIERKIRDFTPPKPFQVSVKVQSFKDNRIKLLTEFACQLPLKVFALVADFSIETCKLPNTSPPAVRTLNLSRKTFIQRPKFVQGVLQRLWVLFLFTRAKCQVRGFHTKVCPNTLTRCWQGFTFYKVSYDIKPIITARVTLDCETTNIPFKLTVFMERVSDFIISPFARVPLPEVQGEAIVFQGPTCLFEREGFKLMAFLDFRSTAKFLEKSVIRLINTPQLLLYRLTRQRFPMRVRGAFQNSQVSTHSSVVRIRQSVLISLTLPLMKILVDLPHIIKQVAKPNTIGLSIKPIFEGENGWRKRVDARF